MTKIAPLTQDIVEKRKEFKKKYFELENTVLSRMDYVLRESMNLLGYKVNWWDTQSEDATYDSEHGSDNCITGNTWYPNNWDVSAIHKKDHPEEHGTYFIDKFGKQWSLFDDQYPVRWLFEDFEVELAKGRIAFLEKEAQEKELKKSKREKEVAKKALLKEQARAKLSIEEQRALGI